MTGIDYHEPFGSGTPVQDACAALWNALHSCADEYLGADKPRTLVNSEKVYIYLDHTPRTSLVAELVDKLGEMGYEIRRK